ncbi:MAG: tetratricopeptide repeat protein [Cyanobacteria bacterium P01_G01_bin.54]
MGRWGLVAIVVFLSNAAPTGGVRAHKTPTEVADNAAEQSATATQLHQTALERYRRAEESGVREQFEQALALYQAAGDRPGEARLLLDLSEFLLFHSGDAKSLQLAQESLAIAQAIEHAEIAAQALIRMGDYHFLWDQPETAQDTYQQSLEIAQAAGDRLGEGRARVSLGTIAGTGASATQPGLAIIREVGTPRDEAFALLKVAYAYGPDSPEILGLLTQSLAKFQEAGDRALFQKVLESFTWLADEQENGAEILRTELQERLAIARADHATLFAIDLLHSLGFLARTEEDSGAAIAYYQQALSLAQTTNNIQSTIASLQQLGHLYEEQDDLSQARDYYEQGFLLARDAGEQGRASRFLSDIGSLGWFGGGRAEALATVDYFQSRRPEFLAAGDIESIVVSAETIAFRARHAVPEARAYLQQSLEMVRSQGQPEQVARILEHLGEMYREQFQFETAAHQYNEALTIYQAAENRAKAVDILTRLAGIYDDSIAPLDAQKAIDFYQQALHIHQAHDIRSQNLSSEGHLLGQIARLYQQQENFTQALRYYQQQIEFYKSDEREQVWGASSIAAVLSNIAELYVAQADYDTAIDYYYRAIEIERQVEDNYRHDYHSIAYKLGKIVELQLKQGNLEAALDIYQEQLDALQAEGNQAAIAELFDSLALIHQQQQFERQQHPDSQPQPDVFAEIMIELYQRGLEILGPDGDQLAIAKLLGGLGEIYNQQEQYELAIEAYQRQLAIQETPEYRQEFKNRREVGSALGRLASIHRQQGDFAAAIESYQQQVEHQRARVESPSFYYLDLMQPLDELRFIYLEQGDFAAAIAVYQNELDFARAQDSQFLYAELLERIAYLYRSRRDYTRALDYYQQQLAVQQNYEVQNQHVQLYTLEEIAKTYIEQGDLTAVLDTLQQRLAIAQEIGAPRNIAKALRQLGNFYLWQEQYSEALSTYEEQMRVAQAWGEQRYIAQAFGLMGRAHHQLKNYDQAISNYQQQFSISQAIGGGSADILRSMGEVYQSQGEYEEALKYYEEYLAIYQQQPSHWSLFDAFSILGALHQEMGEYEQALSYYQQGYDIAQAQDRDYAKVQSLGQFASLFAAQGDALKAIDYYRQAIAVGEAIRTELRTERSSDQVSEQTLNEHVGEIYQDFANLLTQQGRIEAAKEVLDLLIIPEETVSD